MKHIFLVIAVILFNILNFTSPKVFLKNTRLMSAFVKKFTVSGSNIIEKHQRSQLLSSVSKFIQKKTMDTVDSYDITKTMVQAAESIFRSINNTPGEIIIILLLQPMSSKNVKFGITLCVDLRCDYIITYGVHSVVLQMNSFKYLTVNSQVDIVDFTFIMHYSYTRNYHENCGGERRKCIKEKIINNMENNLFDIIRDRKDTIKRSDNIFKKEEKVVIFKNIIGMHSLDWESFKSTKLLQVYNNKTAETSDTYVDAIPQSFYHQTEKRFPVPINEEINCNLYNLCPKCTDKTGSRANSPITGSCTIISYRVCTSDSFFGDFEDLGKTIQCLNSLGDAIGKVHLDGLFETTPNCRRKCTVDELNQSPDMLIP